MNNLSPSNNAVTKPLRIADEKTGWVDRFNERFSEWCSSILVKETRQALKSKHFLWTYVLLLGAVALWTVFGIAVRRDEFLFGSAGSELLSGLLMIMGFPLGIIIPFSAYRSLAKEYEDGTIQLISITTMRPSQIVFGKFGSAVLQMLVYLSVLAPCILFTYLLRGISLPQIVWGLGTGVGFSICLTILGLFLGGAVRSRTLGIGVSVFFVLLLGWLYYVWCLICDEMMRSPIRFDDPETIPALFGVVVFFGSFALLFLVTAASQISFDSDNRSTWIRIVMLLQLFLFLSMMGAMTQIGPLNITVYWMLAFWAGHYWLIMGFLMIGESPKVSRRVQRTLPQNWFSRSLMSLLMPGPGRGYLFAVAMIVGTSIALILFTALQASLITTANQPNLLRFGGNVTRRNLDVVIAVYFVNAFYVMLFLSLVFLIIRSFLHRGRYEIANGMGPAVGLLIGGLLVALATIGSATLHYSFVPNYLRQDYSAICVFNWYWTVFEFSDDGGGGNLAWFWLLFVAGLPIIAGAMLVASKELLQRPIPVPERVLIDQQKPVVKLPAGESIAEIFGEI